MGDGCEAALQALALQEGVGESKSSPCVEDEIQPSRQSDDESKAFWNRRRQKYRENRKSNQSATRKRRNMTADKWRQWEEEGGGEIEYQPPHIVFDLNYGSLLKEKEVRSLASQMNHCYGRYRKTEIPFYFHITGIGQSGAIHSALHKLDGFDTWKVCRHEQGFLEVFKHRAEDIIYLSPEATQVMGAIDESKIYVIGGIVDSNHYKGASLERATELGISAMKLPIAEYVENFTNLSLNVNHVFNIMLELCHHGDWAKAFEGNVPTRKGYNKLSQHLPRRGNMDGQAKDSS